MTEYNKEMINKRIEYIKKDISDLRRFTEDINHDKIKLLVRDLYMITKVEDKIIEIVYIVGRINQLLIYSGDEITFDESDRLLDLTTNIKTYCNSVYELKNDI